MTRRLSFAATIHGCDLKTFASSL